MKFTHYLNGYNKCTSIMAKLVCTSCNELYANANSVFHTRVKDVLDILERRRNRKINNTFGRRGIVEFDPHAVNEYKYLTKHRNLTSWQAILAIAWADAKKSWESSGYTQFSQEVQLKYLSHTFHEIETENLLNALAPFTRIDKLDVSYTDREDNLRFVNFTIIYQPMLLSTASAKVCAKYFTEDTLKANLPVIIVKGTFPHIKCL